MDRFWVVWRVCLAQILCVYDKRTHRGPSDFISGALEQDVRILPPGLGSVCQTSSGREHTKIVHVYRAL